MHLGWLFGISSILGSGLLGDEFSNLDDHIAGFFKAAHREKFKGPMAVVAAAKDIWRG